MSKRTTSDENQAAAAIIGPRLRAAREARRITQERLGRLGGYSANGSATVSISNIERGQACPSLVSLIKMTEALGLRRGWMLDGDADNVPDGEVASADDDSSDDAGNSDDE